MPRFYEILDECTECFPTFEECPFYVEGVCHVADETFKSKTK